MLKQSDLANKLDVTQPLISSWENPSYGQYTLQTLKDLAKAFDVGLLVRFVPFSKLIGWSVELTDELVAPPNFTDEQNKRKVLMLVSDALGEVSGEKETKTYDANSVFHFRLERDEPLTEAVPSTAPVKELTNA